MTAQIFDEIKLFYKSAMEVLSTKSTVESKRKSCIEDFKDKLIIWDILTLPLHDALITSMLRDLLEHAVFSSIQLSDISMFEFFFGLLKIYYFDIPEPCKSEYKYEICAQNLIHLLGSRRLAEFHADVELIPSSDLFADVFIKYALLLEQHLMEGSYNKIYRARDHVPSVFIGFFLDRLILSITNEIADCMESSFEQLTYEQAMEMLHCTEQSQFLDLAKNRKWLLLPSEQLVKFDQKRLTTARLQQQCVLDNKECILQLIEYANAIEAII